MKPDNPAGLEAQVRELTTRVWRLEATLHQHGILLGDEPAHLAADPPVSGTPTPQAPAPQSASWAAEVQKIAQLRQQPAPPPQAAAANPTQVPPQTYAPIAEPQGRIPSFGYALPSANAHALDQAADQLSVVGTDGFAGDGK